MYCLKQQYRNNYGIISVFCSLGYALIYLGRFDFSASISGMEAAGIFTRNELGSVSSIFFLSYALMQIPSGILGNMFSPIRLISIGLFGAALSNLLLPLCTRIEMVRVLWAVNGLVQALIWPSFLRLASNLRFSEGKTVISLPMLTSACSIGTICAYLICAIFSARMKWRVPFWIAGSLLFVAGLLWVIVFGNRFEICPIVGEEKQKDVGKTISYFRSFGATVIVVLFIAVSIGMIKDGVSTWLPSYLKDEFKMGNESSLLLTMAVSSVQILGAYATSFINENVFKNELKTTGFFFGVLLGVLLCIVCFFSESKYGTIVCFALASLFIGCINMVIVSYIPIRFGSIGIVSTVAGFLDAAIYVGVSVSGIICSIVSSKVGWPGLRILWCALSLLGCLMSVAMMTKWNRWLSKIHA